MTFPFLGFCPGNSKPSPFSFTNIVNAGKSTQYTSDAITPTGFDSAAPVTPSAGLEYSIAGGAWTSLITSINPGQTIQVRATSSSSWGTAFNFTLDIGGQSTTWSITTGAVSAGTWDTGWTTGSWTFTTPQFFNWLRIQLWGPGGGGGGGGGLKSNGVGTAGSSGSSGGIAQFAGGPYATGGGYGTGGALWDYPPAGFGANGTTSSHGTGVGGDTNTDAGGAGGGAGGAGGGTQGVTTGGVGGTGGTGGYTLKTYSWGQITPSTSCAVLVQAPGGGGAGGTGYAGKNGAAGAGGSPGRCYIDWA